MSEGLEEPLTALAEGAAQMHEMYAAYIDAGFPEHRAFELTVLVLESSLGIGDD